MRREKNEEELEIARKMNNMRLETKIEWNISVGLRNLLKSTVVEIDVGEEIATLEPDEARNLADLLILMADKCERVREKEATVKRS